jgi:transposase
MWTAAYDAYGEEGLRPRIRAYQSTRYQSEAVHAVLSGQLSQNQAATKFKIAGPATVGRWMKVFMSMERKGFAHLKLEKIGLLK